MIKKTRILILSHEATKSGAPFIILQFLNWLKKSEHDIIPDVFLINGGFYQENFRSLTHDLYLLHKVSEKNPFLNTLLNRIARITGKEYLKPKFRYLKNIANKKYNLLYVNSALTLETAIKIKNFDGSVKILLHLHELETIIHQKIPNFNVLIQDVDHFIVVSNLVKDWIIKDYSIDEENISLIYEFSEIKVPVNLPSEKSKFIVGAAGHVSIRKGFDVFIQIAVAMFKAHPELDLEFRWLGKIDYKEKEIIASDLKKSGLVEKVKFIGEKDNPSTFINEFDIFLLTSREDPFPLVCIEAAMLKKPIICFENATGTQEILTNGGGKIVPYLNINSMCDEILIYYQNPEKVKSDGITAQNLFSEFTPDNMCPKIMDVISKVLRD